MSEFSWENTCNLLRTKFPISEGDAKRIADEILEGLETDVEITKRMIEKYMVTMEDDLDQTGEKIMFHACNRLLSWLDKYEDYNE